MYCKHPGDFNQSILTCNHWSFARYTSWSMGCMNILELFYCTLWFFARSIHIYAYTFCTLSIKVVCFFSPYFPSTLMHFSFNGFFGFSVVPTYLFPNSIYPVFAFLNPIFQNFFPFPIYSRWFWAGSPWLQAVESQWRSVAWNAMLASFCSSMWMVKQVEWILHAFRARRRCSRHSAAPDVHFIAHDNGAALMAILTAVIVQ